MLSILLLCTVAVSATATATNHTHASLPAVCNGTYVERTLEFVDDQALTGTLPPELGNLNLTIINVRGKVR